MTTHPAVIVAAASVFRQWGADVSVGEAPGHIRDTEMALVESDVGSALAEAGVRFADLNYEEVQRRPNRGRFSKLQHFYLPRSVLEADLVVSLPKVENAPLCGPDCQSEEFVWHTTGHCLRLAQECAALQWHHGNRRRCRQ